MLQPQATFKVEMKERALMHHFSTSFIPSCEGNKASFPQAIPTNVRKMLAVAHMEKILFARIVRPAFT